MNFIQIEKSLNVHSLIPMSAGASDVKDGVYKIISKVLAKSTSTIMRKDI